MAQGAWSERLRGALEQEQQPRVGVRHVVSKFVSARKTIRVQRRRLRDAQFHPDPRDNGPRSHRGWRHSRRAPTFGEGEMVSDRRRRWARVWSGDGLAWRLLCREAHLDAELDALQWRL